MKLHGLLTVLRSSPAYRELMRRVQSIRSGTVVAVRLTDAARPFLLAAVAAEVERQLVIITHSGQRAAELARCLDDWRTAGVLLYPEDDALFYERTASDPGISAERLRVMAEVSRDEPAASAHLLVTSVKALMARIMAPGEFARASCHLHVGDTINVSELLRHLVGSGYRCEMVVDTPGTFARRGGIIDVFSPVSFRPTRVELCGDVIETMREFDPLTQRSVAPVSSLLISPARETLCSPSVVAAALSKIDISSMRSEVAEEWQRDLEALQTEALFEKRGFYEAICCTSSLLDYLQPNALLVLDEPLEVMRAFRELHVQAEQLRGEMVALGELPASYPRPYFTYDELAANLLSAARLELSWRSDIGYGLSETASTDTCSSASNDGRCGSSLELGFYQVPSYDGRIEMVAADLAAALECGGIVVIISQQARRLLELFNERNLAAAFEHSLLESPPKKAIVLVAGEMPGGFALASAPGQTILTVLTDAEIFGYSKHRRPLPKKRPPHNPFMTDLETGSYVVHVEHGIGRFVGLARLADSEVTREYIVVEYAEGDRLYVPVDQADRVSKYVGIADHPPKLQRLGSGDWNKVKDRVKAAVREIARELLEIYAAREVKPGFAFSPDTPWQRELEDSFPYEETADQRRAINETKADMERPKPMDRLICGDVGYGKTEVALRAAFKAVMDGKQVAVLVPTTVLAQQHFNTFRERMQAFPIRIEMLSRFRSDKEQQSVIDGLKSGAVDICIGTHRLIQRDVEFKDLGLVIIDEEQRFGVLHKERLKQLRKEVDVLTLTATPIPRTLYLALSGIRDLSTIDTPPEDRLPVKTYVTEYNERLIREAILRELDRGGQVYFVHNRVQSIDYVAKRLAELVPEASIEVGHGQMPEERLEQVMVDFAAGRFDVLVCTTIIESGIDIPNVNTIIVNQADRFGLSQLYQLRGRVGRGVNRAYAYFLFAKGKRLTPAAERRLQAILEAAELGSGYKIAMRDLEIRGAGNLLGTEQHGHVAAVGFDLYCRMLAEAVSELRGKVEQPQPEVAISLPLAAYIPESYVPDYHLRINLYQRMASAKTPEEVRDLLGEIQDRFGQPPQQVLDLAHVLQLKIVAAQVGVKRIEKIGDEIVIVLGNGQRLPKDELCREFNSLKVGHSQLRLRWQGLDSSWFEMLERLVDRLYVYSR